MTSAPLAGCCLVRGLVSLLMLAAAAAAAGAAPMGLTTLPATASDEIVTVFYPSSGTAESVTRGPFDFQAVPDGAPAPFNGRLIVVSHGSGGSPWTYTNLAQALVNAGFVVAAPRHRGDNAADPSQPGPTSWKQRPAEVSRAIDRLAGDPRFGPKLQLERVGVYGMSAGGHTVLTLAGGQWSPGNLKRHCEQHISDDFHSCVGLAARLSGNWFDSVKQWVALRIIENRFDDDTAQGHHDPRIAAAVAGVPFAADFDTTTLITPRVPLGLITAGRDLWLPARFHSDRILAACTSSCELIAALPDGGHGALLSPPPLHLQGLVAELLADPPGFDRSALALIDQRIVAFFEQHLQAERTNSRIIVDPPAPDN